MSDTKCGSYAGWQAHRKHNETPCTACKEAQRQYQANWRRNSPQAKHNNDIVIKAGLAAKRELAKRHPQEYKQLYKSYKKRLASINADN